MQLLQRFTQGMRYIKGVKKHSGASLVECSA